MPTSGAKRACLDMLIQSEAEQEQWLSLQISKKLFAEDRREPLAVKVPKLPTRIEQDLHCLTHMPHAAWCQSCVATRAEEGQRRSDERSDRKDWGKSIVSFDNGFTYVQSEAEEEKQLGTMLVATESETKAIIVIPVLAKGTVSLKQVTEELVRFSMAIRLQGRASPFRLMESGRRANYFELLGLHTDVGATGAGQRASNVRRLANCLRNMSESRAEAKIRGSRHLYPWSFRHAAWLLTRYKVIDGRTSCKVFHDRKYFGKVAMF